MGAADGRVVGTTKVVDSLPNEDGWNLVILSDGYQEDELDQFEEHTQNFIDLLQATPPFDDFVDQMNVFRVNVASDESGADNPAACGGDDATPRTFFDSSFCNAGVKRLLVADNERVLETAFDEVPEAHAVLLIVNSTIYGGAGGAIGVFSVAPDASEIGIHEMGHTAFGLADEYPYWSDCSEDDHDQGDDAEPTQPNVTAETDRDQIKWRDLIDDATAIPTMSNPDCSDCDPNPSPVPEGTVGLFEGAKYFHCGIFRPEFDCKMNHLGQPFCAVCRDVITRDLTPAPECERHAEIRYQVCTRTEDQGYRECAESADQGYRDCCDWWPCSWGCAAWVWISDIVCVVWTWVSNIVCVAWMWIRFTWCQIWR
jgi:hypothetical protein